MKITCIIHSLNGGGAERVMAGLCSRLAGRGHWVTLLTLDDGLQDRHLTSDAVNRISLDVMSQSDTRLAALANTFRRCRAVRAAVLRTRPDVVLSFCDATNVLTLLATMGLNTPIVVSERSDPSKQSLAWPWSVLRPKLYRRACGVIVLTDAAAQAVSTWCRRPATVIASAVDPPPILDRRQPEARTRQLKGHRLVGIGRLEPEKGFDRLIRAFAYVAKQHPEWQLLIVGEGSRRHQLEQQVISLNLGNRVEFAGWVQPVWPILQDADLFALTSRYEGFPSTLLEAMAAGVAAIAVDCESGPRAIIRNGLDGLLITDDDNEIALALDRCMSDAALRKRLGEEATAVTTRYGWDTMVDAYEQLLMSCVRTESRISGAGLPSGLAADN